MLPISPRARRVRSFAPTCCLLLIAFAQTAGAQSVVVDFDSLAGGFVETGVTDSSGFNVVGTPTFETHPIAPSCVPLPCANNGTVSIAATNVIQVQNGIPFDAVQVDVARIPGVPLYVLGVETFQHIPVGSLYTPFVPDDGQFHTLILPAAQFSGIEVLIAGGLIIDDLVVIPRPPPLTIDDINRRAYAESFAALGAGGSASPPELSPWSLSGTTSDGLGHADQSSTYSPMYFAGSGNAARTFFADENNGTGISEYVVDFTLNEPSRVQLTAALDTQGAEAYARIDKSGTGYIVNEFVSGTDSRAVDYNAVLTPGTYRVEVAASALLDFVSNTGSSSFDFSFQLDAPPPAAAAPALGPAGVALLVASLTGSMALHRRRRAATSLPSGPRRCLLGKYREIA
jgi:hypothetical protein